MKKVTINVTELVKLKDGDRLDNKLQFLITEIINAKDSLNKYVHGIVSIDEEP